MKKTILILSLCLFSTVAFASDIRKVAVFKFHNLTKNKVLKSFSAAEAIAVSSLDIGLLEIMPREKLKNVLWMKWFLSDKLLARIAGKKLKAEYIVTGTFKDAPKDNSPNYNFGNEPEEKVLCSFKLINVQTGVAEMKRNVETGISWFIENADRIDLQRKIAETLNNTIEEKNVTAEPDIRELSAEEWYLRGKNYFYNQAEYDKAEKCYKNSILKSNDNPDVYLDLVRTRLKRRNYSQIFKNIKTALELYEMKGMEGGVAESYICLGNYYLDLNDIGKASELYKDALARAVKGKDDTAIARVNNNLGFLKSKQNNIQEALSYYEKALAIATQCDNKYLLPLVHSNIAVAHTDWLKVDPWRRGPSSARAEEHFKSALKISQNISNMGNTYIDLGNLHLTMNDSNSGLDCYYKAFQAGNSIGDKGIVTKAYINMGRAFASMANVFGQKYTDTAICFYNKALGLCQQINSDDLSGVIYANLGHAYETKDIDMAIKYYELALKAGSSNSMALKYALAGLYKKKENYNKAEELLLEVVKTAKDINERLFNQAQAELRLIRILK
ncbi:tetratricopeptide repeat protein [bacterium]|nr:tetratricopeptide repeat protein [Candidatus Omnitrophota bacterium]MBU2529010.1 tetratricopeptide repeat protein [bacterium]MBU3929833.1 tetratricopeptide repeat protein [bacterium]MBU4122626.1 tetratricopeptide repeat protein [bacterium]